SRFRDKPARFYLRLNHVVKRQPSPLGAGSACGGARRAKLSRSPAAPRALPQECGYAGLATHDVYPMRLSPTGGTWLKDPACQWSLVPRSIPSEPRRAFAPAAGKPLRLSPDPFGESAAFDGGSDRCSRLEVRWRIERERRQACSRFATPTLAKGEQAIELV